MSWKSVEERFWAKVDKRSPDECWPWTAQTAPNGYGHLQVEGRPHQAHRVSYEVNIGPIPGGLVIDHLCRNRRCVNPAHLEAVTQGENVRRGIYGMQTHCAQGHEFTPDNIKWQGPKKQWRSCRTCHMLLERRRRAARAGVAA